MSASISPKDPGYSKAANDLRALINEAMADHPNDDVKSRICALFDKSDELWRLIADTQRRMETSVVETLASGFMNREAMRRKTEAMRGSLVTEMSTPLERSLADHVVLAWLILQRIEASYLNSSNSPMSIAQSLHWERKLALGQHRYLKACETLARVQRMSRVHPIQVNIGDQQINVVTATRGTNGTEPLIDG